jgi:hypothetical protein
VKLITLDEVEVKSVPFFAKIDEKTGYIALTPNVKSIYRNERSA